MQTNAISARAALSTRNYDTYYRTETVLSLSGAPLHLGMLLSQAATRLSMAVVEFRKMLDD